MSVAMESGTKEVTIDAVRCEEVHFHAETNGDEKNILLSFNELVTNLSKNSEQLVAVTGEKIKTVINAHEHTPTNYGQACSPGSKEHNSYRMSRDVKSENDELCNTSASHFPYQFVKSEDYAKSNHKDGRNRSSSSKLKMTISLAPHLKFTHPYDKYEESSLLSNKSTEGEKQSGKPFKSVKVVGASSNTGNTLKENSRVAVLKMALDSLTDVNKLTPSQMLKETKLNDDSVDKQDKWASSSKPAKKSMDKADSNNNVSQKQLTLEKTVKNVVEKRNVKVEVPSELNENNLSANQSSGRYEPLEPLPSFCDKSFGQNLTASSESPVIEKGYRCKFCNKLFAKERYVKMHQKVHSEERPYKCNICKKTFRWRSNLNEHQRIHDDKPFQCGVCKQEFSQLSDFRNHQLIHSEETLVKCQCCNKSFDDPRHLKIHYQIHSEDRPFKCTVCDKAFRWRSNLTGHMHIHNINKPYQCEICMQGFTQISNFKNHQLLHSGEKPHQCPECNKTFAQARYLKTHQKLHSEERPYKCKHCGKTFRWPGNLRGHLELHKQNRSYRCDHCGTSFSHHASLSRHINHHCSAYKKCSVPSQTFQDNLEILIKKRQQSDERESEDEFCKGEEQTFHQSPTLLKQLSEDNYNEIHVVFKQHDELQPMISEEL